MTTHIAVSRMWHSAVMLLLTVPSVTAVGGVVLNAPVGDCSGRVMSLTGIIKFRTWYHDCAGGSVPFPAGLASAGLGLGPVRPREVVMDRFSQHTSSCKACSAALRWTQRLQVGQRRVFTGRLRCNFMMLLGHMLTFCLVHCNRPFIIGKDVPNCCVCCCSFCCWWCWWFWWRCWWLLLGFICRHSRYAWQGLRQLWSLQPAQLRPLQLQ